MLADHCLPGYSPFISSFRNDGEANERIIMPRSRDDQIELTVIIPCLNEAETVADCIGKARLGIECCGVLGEVLVVDNGSSDGSAAIAEKVGARVVHVG